MGTIMCLENKSIQPVSKMKLDSSFVKCGFTCVDKCTIRDGSTEQPDQEEEEEWGWFDLENTPKHQATPTQCEDDQIWHKNEIMSHKSNYDSKYLFAEFGISWKNSMSEQRLEQKGNQFACTSRSFICDDCRSITTYTVGISKYRINPGGFAEYCVVLQGEHDAIAIWRRHSHFSTIVNPLKSMELRFQYPKTLASWQKIVENKPIFRCLDEDYISNKCKRLEHLLHDIVFESSSVKKLKDLFLLE